MGRAGTSTAQAVLRLHFSPGQERRRQNKARCHSEDALFSFSPCLHVTTASFLGKTCPSPAFAEKAGRTQHQTGWSGWRHSGSPPTSPVGQLFFGHNLRVCFSHSLSQGDLTGSQAGCGGGCEGAARQQPLPPPHPLAPQPKGMLPAPAGTAGTLGTARCRSGSHALPCLRTHRHRLHGNEQNAAPEKKSSTSPVLRRSSYGFVTYNSGDSVPNKRGPLPFFFPSHLHTGS